MQVSFQEPITNSAEKKAIYRIGNEDGLLLAENGGSCINPRELHPTMEQFQGHSLRSYIEIPHKFVVEGEGNTASIYVMRCRTHSDILEKYGIEQDAAVGAGVIYHDYRLRLVLTGYSMIYRAIPTEAGEEFGKLITEMLSGHIYFSGVLSKPTWIIHPWWRQFGYDSWKQDIETGKTTAPADNSLQKIR